MWQARERSRPDQAEPSFRLAHAYWQLGRVYGAQQSVRRGLMRTPATPDGWCRSAELLALVDGYEDSISLLRKAIEADSTSIRAWRLLAVALERVNRLEEAEQAVSEALAIDDSDPQARLTSARLQRRADRAENAAMVLDDLLSDRAIERGLRISAHYEHAASLDACERFQEAWTACGQAKALLLPHADPYRIAARRAIQTHRYLAETVTQNDYTQWAEQQLEPLPFKLVCVVGHPRSGTTLVEKQLVKATDALDIDEQPFLDAALGRLFTDNTSRQDPVERLRRVTRVELEQARRAYIASLAEFAEEDLSGRLVIDKHPENIRYLPYLSRVFPEASIVIVHRDMRDVVLSCFMLPVPLGPVSVDYLQVDTAANRYKQILAGYEVIVQKLARPPLTVIYEQFVDRSESELQRLIHAIGWEHGEPVCAESSHPAPLIRSPSYTAALEAPNTSRLERWRNYPAVACLEDPSQAAMSASHR